MNIYLLAFSIIFLMHISRMSALPFTDDDGDNFSQSDARRRRKNKQRPCQRSEDGRTFFQVSYVDVEYNYNCGNNGVTHDEVSNQKPQHNSNRPHHHNNNNRPHHNNNKPSNHNNNNDNNPSDQEEENDPVGFSTTRRPRRPLANFIMNHNGAFIQSFFNNIFGNNQKVEESKPIPVHEDVLEDETTKYEPGLYVSAYNPLTGQYLQNNISSPKRIFRRISKGVDYFLNPLYELI